MSREEVHARCNELQRELQTYGCVDVPLHLGHDFEIHLRNRGIGFYPNFENGIYTVSLHRKGVGDREAALER